MKDNINDQMAEWIHKYLNWTNRNRNPSYRRTLQSTWEKKANEASQIDQNSSSISAQTNNKQEGDAIQDKLLDVKTADAA